MQVWSLRRTCVAAQCNELTLGNRAVCGLQVNVSLITFMGILPTAKSGLKRWSELLQMAINTGVAFGMAHKNGITETIKSNGKTLNVSVSNGEDGFTFHTLGLHINTAVEMVGARLAEIAS